MMRRAWQWYSRTLEASPLLTKCATVGVLCATGDAISQAVAQPTLLRGEGRYDFARTARMAVFGCVVSGPSQHVWYGALERVVPGSAMRANVIKTAFDQVLFAPFILTAFFGSQVLLAGQGVQEAGAVVQRSLWPALKLNWVFWPAAQLINFRFVPLQQRVGYVSLCLVFWNAVLSYVHNRNEAKHLQDQQQSAAK